MALDDPIAASAAAGLESMPPQSNAENLLDIDFDGAAPASTHDSSQQATLSPSSSQSPFAVDDLLGVFGNGPKTGQHSGGDLMNGFGDLKLGASNSQPAPTAATKNKDDILNLF